MVGQERNGGEECRAAEAGERAAKHEEGCFVLYAGATDLSRAHFHKLSVERITLILTSTVTLRDAGQSIIESITSSLRDI